MKLKAIFIGTMIALLSILSLFAQTGNQVYLPLIISNQTGVPTPTTTLMATPTPTLMPTTAPTATPTPTLMPTTAPTATPPEERCEPAYANVCIPQGLPDMNCPEIREKYGCDIEVVIRPDPHNIDRDKDGIGCECQ
jgi:hypothetical protein